MARRPVYVALGVTMEGKRDIVGMWMGRGSGESASLWVSAFSELKSRGVKDVFFVVSDALNGIGGAVGACFPQATLQTCVVHLIRGSLRYVTAKDREAVARAMRPVYQAPTVSGAQAALEEFLGEWGSRYPAIGVLWRGAWEDFVPFLDWEAAIRTPIYTTNAIESVNARLRRAVKARGHFTSEEAAMKCLYLAIRSLDPKGTGQKRWMNSWKPVVNTLAVLYPDRMPDPLEN